MRHVALRELLAIAVELRPVVDLGGGRRYIPFQGGTFEGRDGLTGTVMEGGVDWQTMRADGTIEIDAHYTLTTDQREPIEVNSRGLRRAAPEVAARLARGEDVDPNAYYFRTHLRFATAASRLSWLNDLLAVGTGRRDRELVRIDVHEVL
jgi:hypothetical protein